MASPAISALHVYSLFCFCSMDDMDLCHGQTICSRVSEVIYSMVTSLSWKDHILNVIDTPGHDDFLGEVRQGVSMADGAIFVVDVNEGLKGQARFVAEAIQSRLSIILLLNKVDQFEALEERCAEIVTQVGDVLIDNDATEDELNFPVLHASAKDGWALLDLAHDAKDMSQLLEEIIKCVPAPATTRLQEPFQMLVSMISKDDKWGRFMIGRIAAGVISQTIKSRPSVSLTPGVLKIMKRAGLDGVIVEKAYVGDIVSLGGLKSVQVGDTLHIYDFFWVCSMDDMDLCHGQTICSRVSEVIYSMKYFIRRRSRWMKYQPSLQLKWMEVASISVSKRSTLVWFHSSLDHREIR